MVMTKDNPVEIKFTPTVPKTTKYLTKQFIFDNLKHILEPTQQAAFIAEQVRSNNADRNLYFFNDKPTTTTGGLEDFPTDFVLSANFWAHPEDHLNGIDTVKLVMQEKNAEVRAMMLRMYGFQRFVIKGGGRLYMEDTVKARNMGQVSSRALDGYQNGSIYTLQFNGEDLYFLKLINQTIEEKELKLTEAERLASGLTKEGAKIYVLGLPHGNFKSVLIAWQWTFGWRDDEGNYIPPRFLNLEQAKERGLLDAPSVEA